MTWVIVQFFCHRVRRWMYWSLVKLASRVQTVQQKLNSTLCQNLLLSVLIFSNSLCTLCVIERLIMHGLKSDSSWLSLKLRVRLVCLRKLFIRKPGHLLLVWNVKSSLSEFTFWNNTKPASSRSMWLVRFFGTNFTNQATRIQKVWHLVTQRRNLCVYMG